MNIKYPFMAAAMLLALGGCASLAPPSGSLPNPAKVLHNEADMQALDQTIAAILVQPLSADEAVRIGLLNNRSLQASYWNVGIAEADLVQAGRLKNPSFSFQRTRPDGGIEIERSLSFNIIGMLTAPLAQRVEGARLEQVKLQVAQEMLMHAAETRRAFYEAVAAIQGVDYAQQVQRAADASAELAAGMRKAGNMSELDLAREQAFYAESTAAVARANKQAMAAREKLTRLMGLTGAQTSYSLPERLPDLPDAPASLENVERTALAERLDIRAAKQETEHTAAALGLSKRSRFINVLDLAYVKNAGSGYAITLELPLFDWGDARVAKAEAIYMQSASKLAHIAVNARSEAREAYADYRGAYELAKHYRDKVIPLRKKISNETLLRYNGMLLSVFELLADAREQASAVRAYIDASKEYWIAHTNLEAALGAPTGTLKDKKQ